MNDFFPIRNGETHCEDIPLSIIAEQVGTPTYVYSQSHIEAQYDDLDAALKKALPENRQPLMCYAAKANSNLAILSVLKNKGCGLEIVSEGELHMAIRAGFDPKTIVSTGVGKQPDEIAACLKSGILQFNVESLPELQMIQKVAASVNCPATVVFRLNPDVTGGGHHKITTGRTRDKFGIGDETIKKAYAMTQDMDMVTAIGLSMHIGSQVFTVDSFEKAFQRLPSLVKDLRSSGYIVDSLDIGGGFPIVYKDEKLLNFQSYAEWVRDIILPLDTKIIMEPGRYLVGNGGILLSKVLYVKETQERNFLILDAAMNDLIRPTLYEAYHGIHAVKNHNAAETSYDVVGPVCETGDTFTTNRTLPEMAQDDLIYLESAGAYGFCMASNYNARPHPAEILVKGDLFAVIRPRQTFSELFAKDHVPDWLE